MTAKIIIRKDGFTPSRPWYADVEFSDGEKWVSYMSGFKTLKAMTVAIEASHAADFPREREN